ncbi:MAG: tape measure protein [Clostridia bacterium]|nr:tape measure protein [Clostridiales bacterium]MDU7504566.1 tape measure protein [Clostridia bacterium]
MSGYVSRIIFQDGFSSTTKKYAKAADTIGSKSDESAKKVGKLGGAIDRIKGLHTARFKEVGLNAVNKNVSSIEAKLKKVTGKPVTVQATAKVRRSDIRKAKREAKELKRQLKDLTGQKYKIDVDVGGRDISKKMGGLLGKVGGVAKFGLAGIAAAGMGGAAAVGAKGFKRLADIEDAQAMMKGLGYDKKTRGTAMDNALASVKGTAFGLGDAAVTASGAMAAGIKPGAELEGMLKNVANSAAAAGVGMNEMGSIFNKVATSGMAQNDVLNQVADKGIPIYQKLAEQMGVSGAEIKKMAADGKISFDDFNKAMKTASGNVAKEKGNTIRGKMDNVGAAMGRLGANALSGLFPSLGKGLDGLINLLDSMAEPAKAFGQTLGHVGEVVSSAVAPVLQDIGTVAGPYVATAMDLFGTVMTSIGVPALQFLGGVAKDFLGPALKLTATIGRTVLVPVLKALATVAGKALKPAFKALGTAARAVGKVFGWLSDKLSKFKMPSFTSSRTSSKKPKNAKSKHATGTLAFSGGFTQMNENMKGELVSLPTGSKIYPYQLTKRLLENAIGKPVKAGNHNKVSIQIDARGANLTAGDVKRIKDEVYDSVLKAFDNMALA